MPQMTEEEKARRLRMGLPTEEEPPPSTKQAKTQKDEGEMGLPELFLRLGAGTAGGAAGGAIRGGPWGAAIGGALGLGGAAVSPQTAYEQAASSVAAGPFGPAKSILGALGPALAAGGAAAGTRSLTGGGLGESLVQGGAAGAGQLLGPLMGMFRPGALRAGAGEATEAALEKMGQRIGPTIPEMMPGAGAGSVQEVLTDIAQAPVKSIPPSLRTFATSFTRIGATRNFADAPKALFTNSRLVNNMRLTPDGVQNMEKLFPNFVAGFVRTLPEKAAKMGGPRTPILMAEAAYQGMREYAGTEAFKELPQGLQRNFQAVSKVMEKLDPSEASAFAQSVRQGLLRGYVFASSRAGAGMNYYVGGAFGSFMANLSRRFANPEVQEMIRMANKGVQPAIDQVSRIVMLSAAGMFDEAPSRVMPPSLQFRIPE